MDAFGDFLLAVWNSWKILLISLIAIFLILQFTKKPTNFPPGPTGIPFLGAALLIGKRPEVTFAKWRKQYGDIIGFKLGMSQIVVLNTYELIQEALVKHANVFSHRPDSFIFKNILHKNGLGGSDLNPNFIIEKKFTQTSLARLGFGKTEIESAILDESQRLMKHFGEEDVDLNTTAKRNLSNCIGNIVGQFVFGQRYDYDDPEFSKLLGGYEAFFEQGSLAYQLTALMPWSRYLPPVKECVADIIRGFRDIKNIMNQKIADHENTIDESNMRDFIDEYLMEMKKKGDKKRNLYSKFMLADIIRDLYGGSMETVQGALIFAFITLANLPEVAKKVQAEIDSVIGSEGIPHYHLREKMTYCRAVIKEILRYRTNVPLVIPHATSETIIFQGYTIPKGTTILPNLYAVHNDPELWDEPEKFNPDRHIGFDGNIKYSKYFIAFGMGPRVCIGRRLAEMELFILFVTICQQYDFIPTPKPGYERPHVDDETDRTGVVMRPPFDTPLILKRRCHE